MNYGKGLSAIRNGLGMDTIDFSDKCGVTPGTIFKYEENHEKITLEEAVQICKALKVPFDFFMGLSTEVKDVPPAFQLLFTKLVPKLTEATISIIRSENIDGEDLNIPEMNKLIAEIHYIFEQEARNS